jgi:hypothetical protein
VAWRALFSGAPARDRVADLTGLQTLQAPSRRYSLRSGAAGWLRGQARWGLGSLIVSSALVLAGLSMPTSAAASASWGPFTVEVDDSPVYIEQEWFPNEDPPFGLFENVRRDITVTVSDPEAACLDPGLGPPPGSVYYDSFLFVKPEWRQGFPLQPNWGGPSGHELVGEPHQTSASGPWYFNIATLTIYELGLDEEQLTQPKFIGTDEWRWDFECGVPVAKGQVFISFEIWAVPEGWVPPPPPDNTKSDDTKSEDTKLIQDFKKAKKVLEGDRKKMMDAEKDLEEKNDVFCGVSGQMLGSLKSPRLFEGAWNNACGRIPTLVKAYVDADKKLDNNRRLIRKLDQEIKSLERGQKPIAASSGATISSTPARRRTVSRSRGRDPLVALETRRKKALGAMGGVAAAIGKGRLDRAKVLAQQAASRLTLLAGACRKARRHLKKIGLGSRFSRARILRARAQLNANPFSRSLSAFARRLHQSRAHLRRLLRKANGVPKSHIKATAGSDLVCSPKLDSVDRSLAGAFRELAQSL